MVSNGIANAQKSTLDEVIVPKKTSIGVISKDGIFRDQISKLMSEQGHESNFLTLKQLADTSPQKFYVIDLLNFSQYTDLTDAIRDTREKSPDSELILLEADNPLPLLTPRLLPIRKIAKENNVPIYKRPLPPTSTIDSETTNYEGEIRQFIKSEIISNINRQLSNPSILKIGGSLFDLYLNRPEVLNSLATEILILHHEGYPMILIGGGGPRQDTDKGLSSALGTSPYPKTVLERQASTIIELLGDVARYVPPSKVRDYDFRGVASQYIPVVTLVGSTNIPPNQSDTHTLALAELVGSHKVIFAKDTDYVHERDPYKQSRQVRLWYSPATWLSVGENKVFRTILASQILNGVIDRTDRYGNGEHLIETLALMYLNNDRTKNVRAVQVINGTKPELLRDALDGNFRASYKFPGSFILKG